MTFWRLAPPGVLRFYFWPSPQVFPPAYIYMTRKYSMFRFRRSEFTWEWRLAKQALKEGFPIALQLTIVSFGLTFIQRAVNGFGQVMTAFFTVGYRIELYMNLPCSAFFGHTIICWNGLFGFGTGFLIAWAYNGVAEKFGSNDFYAPKTIAEEFWKLYDQRETNEIIH